MSEMCKVIMYKCNYNVTLIRICNNNNEIYMGEIRDDMEKPSASITVVW